MPKKVRRKVLKVNEAGVLKHLKIIANQGLFNQGHASAVQIAKNVFFYQKGTEKFNLSDQEAGKLLI